MGSTNGLETSSSREHGSSEYMEWSRMKKKSLARSQIVQTECSPVSSHA